MKPEVTVLSTGGTIASTETDDGARPDKGGAELVEAAEEAEQYASLTVEEVAHIPSFDMGFETMAAIVRHAEAAATSGTDGIVVTHGTDTMEESAYFADLTLGESVPVVFTGAQRRPDEPSADGSANLINAVRAAVSDPLTAAGGAYVVFNDQVHGADQVTKGHTSRLDTFRSPNGGPLATIDRKRVRYHHEPSPHAPSYAPVVPEADVRVVPSGAGVGRDPIDDALAAGVDGIVVEGTGLGNTTTAIGKAIADATADGVPVVVSSRCVAGATTPVYGGDGGGETLRKHGVGFAGELPAQKARIKLMLAISETSDPLSQFDRF